jgi:hypothetical protein
LPIGHERRRISRYRQDLIQLGVETELRTERAKPENAVRETINGDESERGKRYHTCPWAAWAVVWEAVHCQLR